MKKLLYLLLLTPLAAISCSSGTTKFISAVHDGDTFTDSEGTVYRLYGVDTPEVSDQYHNFRPTVGIEAIYGEEATESTRDLILKHKCIVQKTATDPYGRTVARISYKGTDLSIKLLREGYARVAYVSLDPKNPYYTSDTSYYKALLEAQYYAFSHGLGFWERQDRFKEIFPKAS